MCDILTPVYNSLNKWGDGDDEKQQKDAMRNVVYSNAVKYGDAKQYDALKKYYQTTQDNMDKSRALSCLGCTRDKGLILKTLEYAKDSDEVRKQDKIFALGPCARTKEGKQICLEFLKKTVNEWKEIYGGGGFLLNHVMKLPSGFVTDDKADEIEKYYATLDKKDFDACQKSMKQCVESIRLNARWRKAELKNIQQWIA